MLELNGIATTGKYSGGEYYESESRLLAVGNTVEELVQDIKRLEKVYVREGRAIDFGFVSGRTKVEWDEMVYDKQPYILKKFLKHVN